MPSSWQGRGVNGEDSYIWSRQIALVEWPHDATTLATGSHRPVLTGRSSGSCRQLCDRGRRCVVRRGDASFCALPDPHRVPLAAELQIKAVPTVAGVVSGQLVPLWQGTLAKEDAKARIDELLRMAAKYGIVGKAQPVAPAAVAGDDDGEVAMDPRYAAAYDAMEREDYAAARQEFETILVATPSDAVAKAGRAQSGLLSRVTTSNPQGAVEKLASNPDDLDALLAMADLEAATGALEEAFARLVAAVRSHAGDERDIVRKRLLELYDTCEPTDSTVLRSRRELASALF